MDFFLFFAQMSFRPEDDVASESLVVLMGCGHGSTKKFDDYFSCRDCMVNHWIEKQRTVRHLSSPIRGLLSCWWGPLPDVTQAALWSSIILTWRTNRGFQLLIKKEHEFESKLKEQGLFLAVSFIFGSIFFCNSFFRREAGYTCPVCNARIARIETQSGLVVWPPRSRFS